MKDSFDDFIEEFVPIVSNKSRQMNQLYWILQTTGSLDAADLVAQLDTEYKLLFNNPSIYQQLLLWEKKQVEDQLKQRQINVLVRSFKNHMAPKDLLHQISKKEAQLGQMFSSFRPVYKGNSLTENDIRTFLQKETNVQNRKEIWQASKEIGNVLAPQIIGVVNLRNACAHTLGYDNYFNMQMELQEVDCKQVDRVFEELIQRSENAYIETIEEIEDHFQNRFAVAKNQIGPWAWRDPFCQMDPMQDTELDGYLQDKDLLKIAKSFYDQMGIDVEDVIHRSDLYEKPNKNQHAFCINIDRSRDVRTLNNIRPNAYWLGTVLHEFAHAVYELGINQALPWLLRSPPHMITTEAIALLAGRQIYHPDFLQTFLKIPSPDLHAKMQQSLKRQQLIFARSAVVIHEFEKELYKNPSQDLNRLWWELMGKYQKVKVGEDRSRANDWAAKYHIGMAPVYYFSYLLGELFASSLQEKLMRHCGQKNIYHPQAGRFLQEKLFAPGDSMNWDQLIHSITDNKINSDAWIKEFAN